MRKIALLLGLSFALSSFFLSNENSTSTKIHVSLQPRHHHMIIEWATETEQPGDFYSIEKSLNGKDWMEVTTVLAYEEDNAFYTEIDDAYNGERCFYRIICVHMDHTFHLTAPIAVVE